MSIRPFCVSLAFIFFKVEAVILTMMTALADLDALASFAGLTMGTTVRLQELLFMLSQPGGPYYAPAAVRHGAAATFGRLYPKGKTTRAAFKVVTSILHPAYSINAFVRNAWASAGFLAGGIGRGALGGLVAWTAIVSSCGAAPLRWGAGVVAAVAEGAARAVERVNARAAVVPGWLPRHTPHQHAP